MARNGPPAMRTSRRKSSPPISKRIRKTVESAARVDYGGAVTPAMIQPVIDLCAKYNVIKARFPASDLLAGV